MTDLTGISQLDLNRSGVPFAEAMARAPRVARTLGQQARIPRTQGRQARTLTLPMAMGTLTLPMARTPRIAPTPGHGHA